MKIDTYTKVVLTGIAIFLGFIAFDYKPRINAQAGITGGNEMIAHSDSTEVSATVWHLRDGKIRRCWGKNISQVRCDGWSD
jgi:hypothetical protein